MKIIQPSSSPRSSVNDNDFIPSASADQLSDDMFEGMDSNTPATPEQLHEFMEEHASRPKSQPNIRQGKKQIWNPISEPHKRFRHNRVEWADISRAIALLAIILLGATTIFTDGIPAHVPPTLDFSILSKITFDPQDPINNYSEFLRSFAYPLLFMCIGYTMRKQKLSYASFAYVQDIVGKYMLPYLVFGLLACFISWLFIPGRDLLPFLASLVYGNGGIRGDMLLDAPFGVQYIPDMWIMVTIMIAQLMTFLISRIPLLTRILIAGVLFLVGTASAGHVFLPLDIQPSLCATWYMTCGMILREMHAFTARGWEKILLGLSLTFGIIYIFLISFDFLTSPDYAVANYHNGIIDMIGGVCSGASVMVFAQILGMTNGRLNRMLCWMGENFLATLSSFVVLLCLMMGLSEQIAYISAQIGSAQMLAICSVILVSGSLFGSWTISKIPGLRSMFAHFAPEKGYSVKIKNKEKKNKKHKRSLVREDHRRR